MNSLRWSIVAVLFCSLLIVLLSCQGVTVRLKSSDISANKDKKEESFQGKSCNMTGMSLTELNRLEIDCSIRAILPIDDQSCWFAGSRGQYGYTKDSGSSWHIDSLSHPSQPKLEFRSIANTTQSTFLLSVGSPALLYKSDDEGASWHIVYQEDHVSAFYDALAFWNDLEGIAMGDPTDGCLSIIKTIDGGKTWNKISCDNLPVTVEGEAAFAASNSNIALHRDHVWLVSGGKKARVFHSSDKGVNWSVYDTPIVQGDQMTGIFSVDFFDESTGIIIGGNWEDQENNIGNKAITYDGGKTWSLIADGKSPGYRSCIQYLDHESPDCLIAAGIPGISVSENGGSTWNEISDESFYTIRKTRSILWMAGKNKVVRFTMK